MERRGLLAALAQECGVVDSMNAAGGFSVLVVDDNSDLRDTLAIVLTETLGARVTVAADAEAAITLLTNGDFDVVVSDIRMPGMSGWDLFSWVRPRHPSLPFIVMTAYSLPVILPQALDGELVKPFGIDELIGAIEKGLSGRASRGDDAHV